ncbi:NACHT domain-containing protein [Streptomycetaceae bacterium NBC_01309]
MVGSGVLALRASGLVVSALRAALAPRPGAHSVDEPERIGSRFRRAPDVTPEDVRRLAGALALRLADAEARFAALEPSVGEQVVAEVAVLLRGPVTMDDVQRALGDPGRLRLMLSARNAPTGRPSLGNDAEELFDALADVCCRQLVEHFTTAPWYTVRTVTEISRAVGELHDRIPDPEAADQEFAERYMTGLRDQLDRAEVLGVVEIQQASSYRLSTAYVNLDVGTVTQTQPRDPHALTLTQRLVRRPTWENLASNWAFAAGLPSWHSVLSPSGRAVLEGPAGAGKTSLLRRLAVGLIDARSQQQPPVVVPFFLQVRRLYRDERLCLPAVDDFVRESGSTLGSAQPPGWADRVLRSGHAVVLVDGLDELPQPCHDEALAWLQQVCRDYPHATYILSSRPRVLTDAHRRSLDEAGFASIALRPMNRAQVAEFVTRWHDTHTAYGADSREQIIRSGEDLNRLLDTRRDLARLATSPLLCALICALHRATDQALPEGRVGLYQAAMTMMLGSREQASKVPAAHHLRLSPPQQEALLSALAWWMTMNGRRDIPRTVAEARVQEVLPLVRFPDRDDQSPPTAAEVLRHLEQRSGLLHEPQIDLLEFSHASFQDYLAAGAALGGDHLDHILVHTWDPRYHDVLIMAVGRAQSRPRDQRHLLDGLITRAREGDGDQSGDARRLWLLAAAAIADLDLVSPDHRQAVHEATRALIPPNTHFDAASLAEAGEFVLDLLGDHIRHHELTDSQAFFTIITATDLQSDAAIPLFSALRHHTSHDIRHLLAQAWTSVADSDRYWRDVLCHVRIDDLAIVLPDFALIRRPQIRDRIRTLFLPDEVREIPVSDLAAASHLTTLLLDAGNTDLSGLVELPRVTSLLFRGAAPVDMDALAKLKNLRELRLTAPAQADISALASLTSLTTLKLHGTAVSDLRPLTGLTNLASLDIAATRVTDVGPLAALTSLVQLDLAATEVADVDALAGLIRLTHLSLHATGVADVSALSGLKELTSLRLGGTAITDVSPLAGLTRLSHLDLGVTQVSDLSPLTRVPRLRDLNLHRAPTSDVHSLALLTRLTRLDLSHTLVTDLRPLAELASLEGLFLAGLPVQDVRPLAALTNLTQLDLEGTEVSDVGSLAALTNLTLLNLAHTPVAQLGQLGALPELEVDITGTPLSMS